MAKYFLHVKTFSRANGSRATKAAAYRAGEHIRDERTGDAYNFSQREDVVHKEIVLASTLAGRTDMQWARNRAVLWNAAEHAGRLRNARLAREVLVILPPELSAARRVSLARRFSQELADRYRNAVDLAVHEPRAGSDERHHHAHLLMTTREVTANGLGPRTTLELSGTERHARGLGPTVGDLIHIRERWAEVTNDALREAGLTARVDHRSYRAQGIDREPTPAMPQSIYYAERNTGSSLPAGEEIRSRHRERLEARRQGGDALERVVRRQNEEGHQRALERARRTAALPTRLARGALTREELNQRRREHDAAHREEINRRQRERRRANAPEVNRKQREYLQRRNALKAAARDPSAAPGVGGASRAAAQSHSPAPSPSREAVSRVSEESATARTAVDKWLAYRAGLDELPTAEKSVNAWLAYREGRHLAEAARDAGGDRSRDGGGSGRPDEEPDAEDRRRKQDLGL